MAASCYLDANVCVAYLQLPHVFHSQALNLLKKIRSEKISPSISPLCLDETIHILLRDGQANKVPKYLSITRQHIAKLLRVPKLTIVNPPHDPKSQLKTFKFIKTFNLKPRDAYHLLIMKHHKIKHFATFDNDFDLVFASRAISQLTLSS